MRVAMFLQTTWGSNAFGSGSDKMKYFLLQLNRHRKRNSALTPRPATVLVFKIYLELNKQLRSKVLSRRIKAKLYKSLSSFPSSYSKVLEAVPAGGSETREKPALRWKDQKQRNLKSLIGAKWQKKETIDALFFSLAITVDAASTLVEKKNIVGDYLQSFCASRLRQLYSANGHVGQILRT